MLSKTASIIPRNRPYLFCKVKAFQEFPPIIETTFCISLPARDTTVACTASQSILSPKTSQGAFFRFGALELTSIKATLRLSRKESGAAAPRRPGPGAAHGAGREAAAGRAAGANGPLRYRGSAGTPAGQASLTRSIGKR